MATTTGIFAAAPYAASAPAALPADGAINRVAPSARAIDTAAVMPRALNEPVGFCASSLIQVRSSRRTSGVMPSPSETSPAASGKTSR